MSLLDKFSTVEIKTDNRISEDDRAFCLHQQEGFDKSGAALAKIADMVDAAYAEQRDIFGTETEWDAKRYIFGDKFSCNLDDVRDTMRGRNNKFIQAITSYFSKKYSVALDVNEIIEHLIPKSDAVDPFLPFGGYRNMSEDDIDKYKQELKAYGKAKDKYEASLCSLPLRYEQIVDEIFTQLGGFSFAERSMNEFLERTWNCCHNQYSGDSERFEVKNAVLRLHDYGWLYVDKNLWAREPYTEYKPSDNLRLLLDALAYYECGRMNEGKLWFPELFKYDTEESMFDMEAMSKVKSIKLFKNGRVDIRFHSAAYAQEFVEMYLRRKTA